MTTPVQIVWSYDTTGSMSLCLESVKNSIKKLSARLLRDVPGLEIGLIAHGDYCDKATSYLIKTMPFTQDPSAIEKWVMGVGPTGGGDAPEAYEIALRSAASDFAWKPGARKVLALIGDEIPHEPNYPGNTEHVDWNHEIERLAELGVRCFGVQCLNNGRATYFYKALAERTDGLWLPMKDLQIIGDVFVAVCLQVADSHAFEQFRSQLAEGGPVASALVPLMLRLARKKNMSSEELAALCGIVAKLEGEHGKPPKQAFLPVEGVEISATVAEGMCEVELVQKFKNRQGIAGKSTSFEYRFAVPASSAVFHFEAELGSGKRIIGVVKGREQARQEFRRALAQGQKAFLMEENNADMFSMELGNLDTDETVKIKLRYLFEPEDISGRTLRVRLPQHVAPRSGGKASAGTLTCYPITVTVKCDDALQVSELRSSTHSHRFEVISTAEGPASGRLAILPEHGTLNGDLIFDIERKTVLPEISWTVESNESTNSTVVRLAFTRGSDTGLSPRASQNVAIVLDASASMQGAPYAAAQAAALDTLTALAAACVDVSCSVLLMRHKVSVVCDNVTAREAATTLLAHECNCGGGTDFAVAIDAVAQLSPCPSAAIVISDGQGPEQPKDIFVKARDAGVRIFTIGVGSDPGTDLLHGVATLSGGVAELAAIAGETPVISKRIAACVLAEPMDIKVQVPESVGNWHQWPAKVSAYPGRSVAAYIHLESAGLDEEVFNVNGVEVRLSPQRMSRGQCLHRLAARSRILELERLNVSGNHDALIAELALKQGLASSQTSFVAVEEGKSSEGPTPEKHTGTIDVQQSSGSGVDKKSEVESTIGFEPMVCEMSEELREAPGCAAVGGGISAMAMSRRIRKSSRRERHESPDLMELCARADMLSDCSTSKAFFRMSARPSIASRAASSVVATSTAVAASLTSTVESVATGAVRLKRAFAGETATQASSALKPSEHLPPLSSALPIARGSYFYTGVLSHPAFGSDDHELVLVIDGDADGADPAAFRGRWMSMGQVEAVLVKLEPDRVVISNSAGRGITELRGTVCEDTGRISGALFQDGIGGGRFALSPSPLVPRVEFTDSDGDRLVFVRLLGGGVAEYCNNKLEIDSVVELKVDPDTGVCEDGPGRFRIPENERVRIIGQLIELFASAGARVVKRAGL